MYGGRWDCGAPSQYYSMPPHKHYTRNWKNKNKLDGVGPVDNRPSTDKLHHFVRKKNKKKEDEKREKIVTCDM